MSLELGVWRIDTELTQIGVSSLDEEKRLEDFLDKDISIASPNWMIIGRQSPMVAVKRRMMKMMIITNKSYYCRNSSRLGEVKIS